jgi:putative flippase GtrA
MTSVTDKIAKAAWSVVPAPIERKLRTEAGKRFMRFVPVAVAAVITSQIVLGLLTGPVNLSAGTSGVIASMAAALVSYLLSRWAWERKGKPDWLRETLPFWVVSIAVWVILGLTSHYASVWAHHMGYEHLMKHLVVQGAYFLMNCVTFVLRFLIFHFLLFTDKNRDEEAAASVGADLSTAESISESEAGPLALVRGDPAPPDR